MHYHRENNACLLPLPLAWECFMSRQLFSGTWCVVFYWHFFIFYKTYLFKYFIHFSCVIYLLFIIYYLVYFLFCIKKILQLNVCQVFSHLCYFQRARFYINFLCNTKYEIQGKLPHLFTNSPITFSKHNVVNTNEV